MLGAVHEQFSKRFSNGRQTTHTYLVVQALLAADVKKMLLLGSDRFF